MAQLISDVFATNIEAIRKDMAQLFELEESNLLYSKFKKADSTLITQTVNGTDYRIPLEVQPPSDFGLFAADGGTLGSGNASVYKQMYQTALPHSTAIDLGFGAIATTDSKGQSTINTLQRNLRLGMQSHKRGLDTELFSIGGGNQGLLALSTGYTSGTVTCDTEVGAALLQMGQPVEIYSNDLATQRTSAVPTALPYVDRIASDRSTFHVTNLGGITPGTTDYYALRGAGATPTGISGLQYFHSTASSGNLLGLSRSTYPELVPTYVDASGALTPTHFLLLSTKIFNRFNAVPQEMMGVINPSQAFQIYQVGIAISEWMRGKNDDMIDVVPKSNDMTITVGGVPHLKSSHQSKKRVEWCNMKNWGRVYIKELDFYTDPDGKSRYFEGRNSSGQVTANWKVFMVSWENLFNASPGREGMIINATIPSGS